MLVESKVLFVKNKQTFICLFVFLENMAFTTLLFRCKLEKENTYATLAFCEPHPFFI